jgi:chloramphenicol 3-O-phosphotransferase
MRILGVMTHTLFVVTGAPGSGKTSALEAFLRLGTPYLAYDIDWLGIVASDLAGKDIFFDRSAWRPYGALWFEVLHAAYRNGREAVFFTPNAPSDFTALGLPAWCGGVEWLLLDCAEGIRRERLCARPEWTESMIQEAIEDACSLRDAVAISVDTTQHTPVQVARAIVSWLDVLKPRA